MKTSSRLILSVLWKKELPSSHMGSHQPVYEPHNDSIYISDGWGAFYSAIRLWRISLGDGRETSSVLLRDTLGCLCFLPDGKSIIAVLGKRLVEIDRTNLKIINQWKTKVPQYSRYSNISARTLLLMSWAGSSLSLYDLDNSECRKKKAGSCQGIFRRNDNEFLICAGKEGIIWRYLSKEVSLSKLVDTPQFVQARYLRDTSKLVLALGNPYEIFPDRVMDYSDSEHFRVYDLKDLSYQGYQAPTKYDYFETNADGTLFYLSRKTGIDICTLEAGELKKKQSGDLVDGFEILSIIPECSIVIAAFRHQRELKSILAGVKF